VHLIELGMVWKLSRNPFLRHRGRLTRDSAAAKLENMAFAVLA